MLGIDKQNLLLRQQPSSAGPPWGACLGVPHGSFGGWVVPNPQIKHGPTSLPPWVSSETGSYTSCSMRVLLGWRFVDNRPFWRQYSIFYLFFQDKNDHFEKFCDPHILGRRSRNIFFSLFCFCHIKIWIRFHPDNPSHRAPLRDIGTSRILKGEPGLSKTLSQAQR